MGEELIKKTDDTKTLVAKKLEEINNELAKINGNYFIAITTFFLTFSAVFLSLGFIMFLESVFLEGLITLGIGTLLSLASIKTITRSKKVSKRKELLKVDKICLEEFGDQAEEYGLLLTGIDNE